MNVIVNRYVAILKPKQPFLDWLESQPDWDVEITLEEIRSDRCAYLIPAYALLDQAMRYIERNHKKFFEMELFGCYTDESMWPEKRTLSVFRKWFDIEIHSMIIDTLDDHFIGVEYEDWTDVDST
jgi:hypothetical protein